MLCILNVGTVPTFSHSLYFPYLIEAGQQLYFSGLLMNIIDDTETLAVDSIGPMTGWRRPDDGVQRSATLVLTTCLDGTDEEYHVDCNEFSNVYINARCCWRQTLFLTRTRVYTASPCIKSRQPSVHESSFFVFLYSMPFLCKIA